MPFLCGGWREPMHRVPQPLSPKRPSQYHRPILRVNSYVIGANNGIMHVESGTRIQKRKPGRSSRVALKFGKARASIVCIIELSPRAHTKGLAADVDGDVAMHF